MTKINCKVEKDIFTEKIGQAFDYEFSGVSEFEIPEIDFPNNFNIGIIVGSSGSGKTQIIKNYFNYKEHQIEWKTDKAIISHFETPDIAIEKMFAVGLSSIPTLCKPYHVLSNGEKFRAEMARIINSNVCIDEFTSVVNRETAKSLSVCISKYIRKNNLKNIIFVSCHKDILEWLEPDWVFDCDKNEMGVNDIDFSKRKKHATITIY